MNTSNQYNEELNKTSDMELNETLLTSAYTHRDDEYGEEEHEEEWEEEEVLMITDSVFIMPN
jgi:hypothetical protein